MLFQKVLLLCSSAESNTASPKVGNLTYDPNEKIALISVIHLLILGDVVITESLSCEVGEKILLKKILLVGTKDFTAIGKPLLTSAAVEATIEEQTKAAKVIIFKKKRRKNYARTKGHRQPITVLRVGDIRMW